MNYKIGDLVTITGNSTEHGFSIGETARLAKKWSYAGWCVEYLDGHDWWGVRESDMKPAQLTYLPQKIVITTDGKITLARLYDGKTMVKRAEAKYNPADIFPFDFTEGASRAFERLTGRKTEHKNTDKPEAKPAENEPVKLYCVKSFVGLTKGKVYEFDGHRVNYDGMGCFYAEDFEAWKDGDPHFASCLVPLVHRPAKVGEWIIATTEDGHSATVNKPYKVTHVFPDGWVYVYKPKCGYTCIRLDQYLVFDGYKGD